MRERRLTDVSVIVTAPERWWSGIDMQREMVSRRSELEEFIEHARNHRDLDGYVLDLHQLSEEVCSFCGREWEVGEDEVRDEVTGEIIEWIGEPLCCQAAQSEWHAERAKVSA
jgi:hypothetical protein